MKLKYVDIEKDVINNDISSFSVIYLNPVSYLYYRKNVRELIAVDGIVFDGLFMTWLMNKLIFRNQHLRPQAFDMSSIAPFVLRYCVNNNKNVFVCGGTQKDVENFTTILEDIYPDITICGSCDGYSNKSTIVSRVKESNADIVLLGLGGTKQDEYARYLNSVKPAVYLTCGAFISQTANSGEARYYPEYIQRYNLRWFYRIFNEKGIFTRILIKYPHFLLVFVLDYFKFKLNPT